MKRRHTLRAEGRNDDRQKDDSRATPGIVKVETPRLRKTLE